MSLFLRIKEMIPGMGKPLESLQKIETAFSVDFEFDHVKEGITITEFVEALSFFPGIRREMTVVFSPAADNSVTARVQIKYRGNLIQDTMRGAFGDEQDWKHILRGQLVAYLREKKKLA